MCYLKEFGLKNCDYFEAKNEKKVKMFIYFIKKISVMSFYFYFLF